MRDDPTPITTTEELARFCAPLATVDYVTVDTEFMRETTYWPKVCLIQIAGPDEARVIDPLAEGLSLEPLLELLRNKAVLKVFHAARQDLEIFYKLMGEVPAPLFDSQVAAMVCGFGDQVSYEQLVSKLAGAQVDKSSRFTDWARRPLTEKQVRYALGDVTYLRKIYEKLNAKLVKTGRADWLREEMALLADPETYETPPDNAWRRLKPRTAKGEYLAVLQAAAAWREVEARHRDIPRQRIVRDETLMEIASHPPKSADDLERMRGLSKGFAEGKMGQGLLAAISAKLASPKDTWPVLEREPDLPRGIGPLVELLKVLLKLKCDDHDVAQKLLANSSDLDRIAADDNANVPAMQGWRREMFGEDALRLKRGEIALAVQGMRIKLVDLKK
ncbi:ribonuclease D [Ferrovibrio terrae]|uniref:Ribonuclease D n=1 Tax=Ferrovibrio terrae TaxID=2594003 RepID=A0A516H6D3_9PROT|nr:ribonuclease D [Ferrovibrio terrae]QDO99271.1 ribonuclease D [Ferrovibrio terrae]